MKASAADLEKIHFYKSYVALPANTDHVDVAIADIDNNDIPVIAQRCKVTNATDLYIVSTYIPEVGKLRLIFNKTLTADWGVDFSLTYYK